MPNFTNLSVSEYIFMEIPYTEFYPTRTNNVANRAKHCLHLWEKHVIHCIDFHDSQNRKYVFILSVRYICPSLPKVEVFLSILAQLKNI